MSAYELEVLHPEPGVGLVVCTGEHDLTTRQEVADLLKRLVAENELVVVDVSDAKFIDSSFVNNLFIANGFASEQGKQFRLQFATEPIVRTVLEISGVLGHLDCVKSRDEALRRESARFGSTGYADDGGRNS